MLRSLFTSTKEHLLSVNWTLLALRTWTFIHYAVNTSIWASKKTYAAVTDAFSEEKYVFFKGDSTPYPVRHVILDGPGIASVSWTYNKNTKTFVSSTAGDHTRPKYLEWLSASIQYNGLNLYSLDDLIEGTHFLDGSGTMPSNDILVASWSLSSGVVLDKTIDLKLFVIHSDGREETVSLWKQFEKPVEAKQTKKEEKVPKKEETILDPPKNTLIFPTTILSDSTLSSIVNERLMTKEDIQTIVKRTTTTTIDDVSGNSEIPLTNGVPEVDFEKVD
jgi:hypothetical protein